MESSLLLVEHDDKEDEEEQQKETAVASGTRVEYPCLRKSDYGRQLFDPLLPFRYRTEKKEIVIWAPDREEADAILTEFTNQVKVAG